MTRNKASTDQTEYKFTLLEHARQIVLESQPFMTQPKDYAGVVIDLAERIHNWIQDNNETK